MASFGRGDYFALAKWVHPHVEYVQADGPDPGSATGLAGMEKFARGFLDAWDEHRTEADGYREIGAERVLVFCIISGRGKTSGMPMRTNGALIFDLRDGKVTRCVIYWNRERALADLGLAPEA